GVGPEALRVTGLAARAADAGVREVILALPATVDGQTTAHYLADRLASADVIVSMLARGVPVGGDLDWLDGGTLAQAAPAGGPAGGRSQIARLPVRERSMNELLPLAGVAAAAAVMGAWAVTERLRATRLELRAVLAEARMKALEERATANAELVKAQAAESA